MKTLSLAALLFSLLALPAAAQNRPHNIILFVADGLRYGSVEPGNTPNMARLKREGVDFTNSHSLYPTLTMANGAVIATGHYPGDTGDYGNIVYAGSPLASLKGSPMGFLENDAVLGEMNQKFGGNYLGETSLVAAARAQGWQTAVIGKLGPARLQDLTAAEDGSQTLILDDSTGHDGGLGLPSWFTSAMAGASVAGMAPGVAVPNTEQEAWMSKAATGIVLPHFKQSGKPFLLVFWSRDPDMSQHNGKDSLGRYEPGINGPSGKAGIHNADIRLGELLEALKKEGLDQTTDIFVTADHGFTTISHASEDHPDLPSRFLARDLAALLNLPQPSSGLLGADGEHPQVVIAQNGGSDLIYMPGANARDRAEEIVSFLMEQDYTAAVFVNDALGRMRGALPMSMINLIGSARAPVPAIYVSFRSFAGACADALLCAMGVSDTPLATGQGNHGGFSRAETRNFMAAIGPGFKKGFADPAPVSNADIAPTLAQVMGLTLPAQGKLVGRVISEALPGGAPVQAEKHRVVSEPDPNSGLRTVLEGQAVGQTRYFDAAGIEGRAVGISAQ